MGANVSPWRFLARKTHASFTRGGYHRNKQTKRRHYTFRGFKSDGFAYSTIHAFSSKYSAVFSNGGNVWKEGGRRLDVEQDCELLWCVTV